MRRSDDFLISTLVTVILAPAVMGCSGGRGSGDDGDAGADTGGGDLDAMETEITAVTPDLPAPSAPPVLTPCPPGWRESSDPDTGVVVCEPWPEGGVQDCADHEAHFPGETGCSPVGPACPDGDWADDLPGDRDIIYVHPDASAGGDGSESAPFATILEAHLAASEGAVVALARGTYDEAVIIPAGVTLWGACVEETRISPSTPSAFAAAVTSGGAGTAVRNLTVSGSRMGLQAQNAGRSMDVENVVVFEATAIGISATLGADITGRRVVVRNTRSDTGGDFGYGIEIVLGASLDMDHVVVTGSRTAGVRFDGADTDGLLVDSAVLGTEARLLGDLWGRGIEVGGGAAATLERVAVEGNREAGVYVIEAEADMIDVVIRDTREQASDSLAGRGVAVFDESRVTCSRCLFEGNRTAGFGMGGASSFARLEDVVVREQRPRVADGYGGRGIEVERGTLEVERAQVLRNRDFGLAFLWPETTATIEDVLIQGTLPNEATGIFGCGIGIADGASVALDRAVLQENSEIGLTLQRAGILEARDVTIRDTRAQDTTGLFGRGLNVQEGSQITLERGLFEGNRETCISVFNAGSIASLSHVTVTGTLERACAETTCPDARAGIGLGVYDGASVTVETFSFTESALAAFQLAHGESEPGITSTLYGSLDLTDGEVAWNTIGVNLQDESYDVERLMQDVSYHDNERNLDVTLLPVPGMGDLSGL